MAATTHELGLSPSRLYGCFRDAVRSVRSALKAGRREAILSELLTVVKALEGGCAHKTESSLQATLKFTQLSHAETIQIRLLA
jgi:hypothetical protein